MKKPTQTGALLALMLIATMLLSACGSPTPAPSQPASEPASGDTALVADGADTNADALTFDKTAEGPYILTSIGQGGDFGLVENMLNRIELDYTSNSLATADDIASAGTLFVVTGASSKGLGAAGISTEEEYARGEALLKAAKDNGSTVIALHVGGSARRGELSDQMTDMAFGYADYIIMTKDGNEDGHYTDLAANSGIPITVVGSFPDCIAPLSEAIGG